MDGSAPEGVLVLDRLFEAGRIDQDQYDTAVSYCHRVGVRAEEGIIQTRAMNEADFLKFLASMYKTRFVSTEKLAKANVGRALIKRIPRKVAERLLVCPILFDPKTHTLSVVAGDLGTHDVKKQIAMVTEVRAVRVFVARPAAVLAMIRKHYHGDLQEFAMLLSEIGQVAESNEVSLGSGFEDSFGGGGGFGMSEAPRAPKAPASSSSVATASPEAAIEMPGGLVIDAPDVAAGLKMSYGAPEPAEGGLSQLSNSTAHTGSDAEVGLESYLESLNILVALLEQDRGDLRGHTSQVARLCRKVCERIGLTERQSFGTLVAAYLHDLGKTSSYHLTALNVAQYEGHRLQAQKTYLSPVRLMESASLPESAIDCLSHLYERVDGRGFPDRLKGKEIPLGARILAVVETYVDLTSTEKNPYRKRLPPSEACDALGGYKDQFFDPTVVDLLKTLVLGDDLRAKLLEERHTAILVDPDPEETTVLEMRLMEHGFDVAIARTAAKALERIAKGGVDIVVSEVELEAKDGFHLLQELRRAHPSLPLVFLTRRGDRDSVQKGFSLGAADYLAKPASPEVVAAKITQILERAEAQQGGSRGVSGSLREMSLPDVIQILSNGRKSGRLTIRADGKSGDVCFAEGQIWQASYGSLENADAFYAMLQLLDGEFSLDPSFTPTNNVIQMATESLLLEGMRRLDEGTR